jgi:multicomponent Na+:H+ antiporter subunit F
MIGLLLAAAAGILVSLGLALFRVAIGPTVFDRMLAAQIFGSGGVGILALLAFATDAPSLLDAALALALLAAVTAIAFVRRVRPEPES